MKKTAYDPYKENQDNLHEAISLQKLIYGEHLLEEPDRPMIEQDGITHLYLMTDSSSQECPYCGAISNKCRGTSEAHRQWMPLNNTTTVAHIKRKRFVCSNPDCMYQSFSEMIPGCDPYKHSSVQARLTAFAISIFCSAVSTQWICAEMGISISHDTITRMLNDVVVEDEPDIEKIGVDDVCFKKGQTYNTVIYDASDHHLVAMLDGRTAQPLKEWLAKHPNIKIAARDRASAYAKAIKDVLPDCLQVADRFHILQNLIGYLKDIFKSEVPSAIYVRNGQILDEAPEKNMIPKYPDVCSELKNLQYDEKPPVDENGNEIIIYASTPLNSKEAQQAAENRKQKQETVKNVRKEWEASKQGKQIKKNELAQMFGISVSTVKKYLNMTDEAVDKMTEINHYHTRNVGDPRRNIIYKMLRDGHSPAIIYVYLCKGDYTNEDRSVEHLIESISYWYFGKTVGHIYPQLFDHVFPEGTLVLSRQDILKYITCNEKTKKESPIWGNLFRNLCRRFPAVMECHRIWKRFHGILMGDDPKLLDDFIKDYKGSGIDSFVKGLEMDIDAVKAAITEELNSGFVEGGNCKEKLVKRIGYGRSSTGNLFKKCYLASMVTCKKVHAKDMLRH